MNRIIDLAKELGCSWAENEPMSAHTSFKIGGPARLVVYPRSRGNIGSFVKACNEYKIRYMAVGNGSNLLVADEGIDACVIAIGADFADVRLIDDTTIYADAGASLMKVCRFALEHELTGMEFAYGIPGSCGGAAFMNAGAYGGEMKDVLYRCEHIDSNGDAGAIEGDALGFGYRHSAYYDNGCIVTGVYIKLEKGNADDIKAKMDDLLGRRKDKQPVEYPSAGSTFKRPTGYYAGTLIEDNNLKGVSVGGAQVSTKHAGFVINTGGATCQDVLDLCKLVSDTVYKNDGVKLEMEIRVTK